MLAACSSSSPERDGGDETRDSEEAEDAEGTDAPVDVVATDTEPSPDVVDAEGDIGADAADGGPTDPGWVAMPGLPEECSMERALYPERVSEPTWISCGTGCEWLAPHPTLIRAGQPNSGWHDGEQGFLWVIAQDLGSVTSRRRETWLMDDEGVVRAAWRAPPRGAGDVLCLMKVAAAAGRAVAILKYFKEYVPGSGRTYLYFGDVDGIKDVEEYQLEFDESVLPRGLSLDSPSLSESLFAARLLPSGDLFLIRPDLTWERQSVVGEIDRPYAVDDAVVYVRLRFSEYATLEVARFGEPAQVLLADDAFLFGLHIDWENRAMSWLRFESPGSVAETTRTDVYTAPLTTDPASLRPRLVRNLYPETDDDITRWVDAMAGDGFYANFSPTFFVSLADGSILRQPSDLSRNISGTLAQLWIADGYRYFSTLNDAAMPPGLGGTILRQRLDSLIPE